MDATAHWLCYSLKYDLNLQGKSKILAVGQDYKTWFYPFQRPFFTAKEASADYLILQLLKERATRGVKRVAGSQGGGGTGPKQKGTIVIAAGMSIAALSSSIMPVGSGKQTIGLQGSEAAIAYSNINFAGDVDDLPVSGAPYSVHPYNTVLEGQLDENPHDNMDSEDDDTYNISPELSNAYTGHHESYSNVWADVIASHGAGITVDGEKFEHPAFVVMGKNEYFTEISPDAVAADTHGNPYLKPGSTPLSQPFHISHPFGGCIPSCDSWSLDSAITSPSEQAFASPLTTVQGNISSLAVAVTPRPASAPPAILSVPTGFMLTHKINLFGQLPIALYTLHDASDTTTQLVQLTQKLSLGTLIPTLKDSPLDMISLENTTLTYTDATIPAGLTLSTEVHLTGALSPLNDILRDLFGQTNPRITLSGMLTTSSDWTQLPKPIGFTLRSELQAMSMDLFGCITIKSLGIDVMASRTVTRIDGGGIKSGYDMSFGFFGVALLGGKNITPLRIGWYIMKSQEQYSLTITLEDEDWKDVMGITGLTLENVTFMASFSAGAVKDSVQLAVEASFSMPRAGAIFLQGHFGKGFPPSRPRRLLLQSFC